MFFRRLHALAGLVMMALSSQAVAGEKNAAGRSAEPRTLTTQFSYTATVPEVPSGAQALDLWLPVPSDSEWQTVSDITVEGASEHKLTQEKQYGNRMVYIRAENPEAPVAVTVRFVVERKDIKVLANASGNGDMKKSDKETLKRFLKEETHVPVGGRFGEIAQQVASEKSDSLEKARALYEHVVEMMQYDYKKESPKLGEGDVPFVCDYKKGNCSDLHSYYISLARSIDIPSVLEYGFPLAGIPLPDPIPQEGKIGGYHCWTWIYDQKVGWMPLDASDGRRWLDSNVPETKNYLFGNLVLERAAVAFSRGRDITLEPPQKGASLNNFIYPYAEADGKPVKAAWDLNYRLIKTDYSLANLAGVPPAVSGRNRLGPGIFDGSEGFQ